MGQDHLLIVPLGGLTPYLGKAKEVGGMARDKKGKVRKRGKRERAFLESRMERSHHCSTSGESAGTPPLGETASWNLLGEKGKRKTGY